VDARFDSQTKSLMVARRDGALAPTARDGADGHAKFPHYGAPFSIKCLARAPFYGYFRETRRNIQSDPAWIPAAERQFQVWLTRNPQCCGVLKAATALHISD